MALTAITLTQFEQIDSLLSACLRRPDLEALIPLGREATTEQYFRPEWRLEDALVAVFGLEFVNDYASAVECAAKVVADALLCQIDVLDEEAA